MTNDERNPKSECRNPNQPHDAFHFRHSSFELLSDFVIRNSSFFKAMNRREFLTNSAAALALASAAPTLLAEPAIPAKRTIKTCIMWSSVGMKGSVLDKFKTNKAAGFPRFTLLIQM